MNVTNNTNVNITAGIMNRTELRNNGITIPYHFTVTDRMGNVIYHCSDFIPDGSETFYSHVLFRNDPPQRMGVVNIHFPTMDDYIFSSVRFMIPAVIFTLVLLMKSFFISVNFF